MGAVTGLSSILNGNVGQCPTPVLISKTGPDRLGARYRGLRCLPGANRGRLAQTERHGGGAEGDPTFAGNSLAVQGRSVLDERLEGVSGLWSLQTRRCSHWDLYRSG